MQAIQIGGEVTAVRPAGLGIEIDLVSGERHPMSLLVLAKRSSTGRGDVGRGDFVAAWGEVEHEPASRSVACRLVVRAYGVERIRGGAPAESHFAYALTVGNAGGDGAARNRDGASFRCAAGSGAHATWFEVVGLGRLRETARRVRRGEPVSVAGTLGHDEFTRADGSAGCALRIHASRIAAGAAVRAEAAAAFVAAPNLPLPPDA